MERMGMENLTVTERAARRIGEILRREPPGTMLRLSVEGGGCSGFQYKFDMDRAQAPDDIVIARDGARVLIDQVSLGYLAGSEIDFVDDLIGRRLPDQQSEGHRLLRLRHQLRALGRNWLTRAPRPSAVRDATAPPGTSSSCGSSLRLSRRSTLSR